MAEDKTPKDVAAADAAARLAKELAESKDSGWKKFWEDSKGRLVRLLGALVMEKNKRDEWVVSVGRVSWWMAFIPALYIWLENNGVTTPDLMKDITPNHLTILLTLAGYNFGKKVMDGVNSVWGKGDGPG